ncbi:MAG TPA: SAM-dependent methyltransferase [Salinimicrobium sp.]|nr:SAM-dependent methyltransferase [Salinimicrobium sp.]
MSHSFKYSGKLFLIPSFLGENSIYEVLPATIAQIIAETRNFIVENDKTARKFIKAVVPTKDQASLNLLLLNKHTDPSEIPSYLNECKNGTNIGLLSEAGCPGIADPGAEIVKIAHNEGIQVVPLVGPSSILLALMASGMNGQSFAFNGYLPIEKHERKQEIRLLEKLSSEKNQTQAFIETPYRNNKMMEDLIQNLQTNTRLCVACDITLKSEFIATKTIGEWKKSPIDLHKRPTIFVIQKDF